MASNKSDISQLQEIVEAFNKKNPIGSEVAVKLDSGKTMITKVRAPAQILCGSIVAWFDGITGCYSISNVWRTR
jgi:hypothetical protein